MGGQGLNECKSTRYRKNVVQLEIEIDASKFDEGMEKSYRKNMKRFSIPGFRKERYLEK